MLVSGNRTIMGNYVNKKLATTLGWTTFTIMATGAIALILTSRNG